MEEGLGEWEWIVFVRNVGLGGGGNKRTKTYFLAKYYIFYDINYNIDKKWLIGSDALAKAFVGFSTIFLHVFLFTLLLLSLKSVSKDYFI